jgi:EmrB/QacA subfamily drug resistance transporter
MTIVYAIVPRHKIGMALGLWGVAMMAAPAIGPTLSGYLVQHFSWRLLFFISVPVGIFAVIVCIAALTEMPRKKGMTFDIAGCLLSIVCFGTLLLALSKGQSEGWTSLYIVGLLYVSFFSLLLLVWVETGKEQPLLDFSLFKNPVFTVSLIAGCLVTVGLYGGVFLTPLYLQNVLGQSPVQTGLTMLPQSLAMALMMPISGRLFDKIGVVPLGLTGLVLLSTMTLELHQLSATTSVHWLDVVLTVRGFGIGLCMMPLTTVGMNSVARDRVGRASSLSNLVRQVAGSLSIAVLTTIMTDRQIYTSAKIAENITGTSEPATNFIGALSGGFASAGLDAGSSRGISLYFLSGIVQKEALVRAIADTFMYSALPLFICIPTIFLFVKRKKRSEAAAGAQAFGVGSGTPAGSATATAK